MVLAMRGAAAPRMRLFGCLIGKCVVATMATLASPLALAQPSSMGLTGLMNMPSARMEADGTLTAGFTYARPYSAPYVSAQMLPFLQVAGRYTRIHGVPALTDQYGDEKDKSASFKLQVLKEGAFGVSWLPDVAIGMDDFQGTQLFRSEFVVATKRLDFGVGHVDATLGYGRKRIDGLFGGARIGFKALPSWALVAEYDRNNYSNDPSFSRTGEPPRKTGAWGGALEYRYGAMTLQVGRMHGQNVYNVSFSVPLQSREFIPKLDETGPFPDGAWASTAPRPTAQQWQNDRQWRQKMLAALHDEGLRDVRLAWRDGTLALSFAGDRYRYASRGIGRAAQVALAHAPLETERMELTWETHDMAGMTWVFYDVSVLQQYMAGNASRAQLAHAMTLQYADPNGRSAAARANDIDDTLDDLTLQGRSNYRFGRSLLAFTASTASQSSLSINPYVSTYLNDPSGAFKYDVGLRLGLTAHLARGWWLKAGALASLRENISDVSQASNSELPHVRSDLAEYRKAARVKLHSLTVSRYWQPATRTYVRASAGLYEEMFGGVGMQALYLDKGGRLAWDVSVDAVRQRNFKGNGFTDYKTVTALASMHYRVHGFDGLTATVRAGRFLARDNGVRFELSRTFNSGIELGLWYTRTNGNDTMPPGAPGSPYFDKGVFMRIPLSTLTTRDTSSGVMFGLSPWNRDVGQMVESPGDLYTMMRRSWMDNAMEGDGLRSIGDVIGEDAP